MQSSVDPPSQILGTCETLNYARRIQYVVARGKSANDQDVQAISHLSQSSSLYHRLLALYASFGSKDPIFALQALASGSKALNKIAIRHVAVYAPDEQVLEVSGKLDARQFHLLCQLLRRRRRFALIDRLLVSQPLHSDQRNKKTVFLGTSPLVERHLKDNPDKPVDWKGLTRYHPQLALDLACERLLLSEQLCSQKSAKTIDSLLPLLVSTTTNKHNIMDLLLYPLKAGHDLNNVRSVARRFPNEVIDAIMSHEYGFDNLTKHLGKVPARLPLQTLLSLCDLSEVQHTPFSVFKARIFPYLSPKQRLSVYKRTVASRPEERIDISIVTQLPKDLQISEARRFLAMVTGLGYFDQPKYQIPWAALLPWDVATELLQKLTMGKDVASRSSALSKIIRTTPTHRYMEALDVAIARKNDQDQIRLAIVEGLTGLEITGWTQDSLPKLEELVRCSINAKDLSHSSERNLADLIAGLLPVFPAWAYGMIMLIHRRRDRLPTLVSKRRESGEWLLRLADVMSEDLPTWETEVKVDLINWAVSLFHGHLSLYPKLQQVMINVMRKTSTPIIPESMQDLGACPSLVQMLTDMLLNDIDLQPWNAKKIIASLSMYDKRFLESHVDLLLFRDPTFLNFDLIFKHVCHHRQDLLTPFLDLKNPEGRFQDESNPFSNNLKPQFFPRLTQDQQEILAQRLSEGIEDNEQAQDHVRNMDLISGLTFVNEFHILHFAEHEREYTRDDAVRRLAHLDSGKGLSKMLDFLESDDARAKVVIYCFRTVIKSMPKEKALSLLQNISSKRVTIAKQVVRLVGELRTDAAFQHLLKLEEEPLHVDVRAALYETLKNYLDRAETWQIIAQATMATSFLDITDVPACAHASYFQFLLHALSNPEFRQEALKTVLRTHLQDKDSTLLPKIVELTRSNTNNGLESKKAAKVLFSKYNQHFDIIRTFFREVDSLKRLVRGVADYEVSTGIYNRSRDVVVNTATTKAIAGVLLERRYCLSLHLRVIFLLPWDDLFNALSDVSPHLHADALVKAENLFSQLYRPPLKQKRADYDRGLEALEAKLRSSRDEKARRLGLAALAAYTRQRSGWNNELRRRLVVYQEDESVMISEAAKFMFAEGDDSESWGREFRSKLASLPLV